MNYVERMNTRQLFRGHVEMARWCVEEAYQYPDNLLKVVPGDGIQIALANHLKNVTHKRPAQLQSFQRAELIAILLGWHIGTWHTGDAWYYYLRLKKKLGRKKGQNRAEWAYCRTKERAREEHWGVSSLNDLLVGEIRGLLRFMTHAVDRADDGEAVTTWKMLGPIKKSLAWAVNYPRNAFLAARGIAPVERPIPAPAIFQKDYIEAEELPI